MPADVQMNYGSSSAHVQWFSHWNIGEDDHDVIIWCHEVLLCYRGRELYKESVTEPWGFGCCYYCHLGVLTSIWVFTKPQTLYFCCLGGPRVGNISRMYSVVCFSISMHPDLFGGLWVIVTSFIWWRLGGPLPPPLEPGIEWSTDHNPSVAICEGRINC